MTTHKGTILIAEDDNFQVELFNVIFGTAGFKVLAFSDGAEIIDMVEKHDPDLIILDINLPHVNGLDIARRLHADPDARNIPVIMVSGLEKEDNQTEALVCGCIDFIQKPCDNRDILRRVEKYIRLGKMKKRASKIYGDL